MYFSQSDLANSVNNNFLELENSKSIKKIIVSIENIQSANLWQYQSLISNVDYIVKENGVQFISPEFRNKNILFIF